MSGYIDTMIGKWPSYERSLRELVATKNLLPEKLDFVLLAARDAYLRSAPSLVEVPDCPPEIHQYVRSVTLGLLAQVAWYAGASFDISAAGCKAYGAVLTERSGPLDTPTLNH